MKPPDPKTTRNIRLPPETFDLYLMIYKADDIKSTVPSTDFISIENHRLQSHLYHNILSHTVLQHMAKPV